MNRQQRRRADRQARKAPRQHSAPIGIGGARADTVREIETAVQLHQLGELDRAADIYRRILNRQPNHAAALQLMGVVAHQKGQSETAIELINRALAIEPDFAAAHNNLGAILIDQGKSEEAITCFQRAIEINPDHVDTHNNLGIEFMEQGRLEEAAACFERALTIAPECANAHFNLGNLLAEQGMAEGAIASYRRATAIQPNLAAAHNNLGDLLRKKGNCDEALTCFQSAVASDSNYAEAYNNAGVALKELNNLAEAATAFRRALTIKEDYSEAHNNLGNTLKDQGNLSKAQSAFRAALAIKPDSPPTHSNLLFCMGSDERLGAEQIFAESRRWDEIHAAPLAARARPHANDRDPERRLRVGYVSPDLRTHSVSYFFEPLLAAHDRRAVEVFCYAEVARPDGKTAQLQSLADGWYSTVGVDDADMAERIRADRIDILVDLAGHTGNNRLPVFARRPAPIQATWLGYGGTTGMTAMDYRLSDAIADPQGDADALHSETLVRLPDGFFCYAPPPDAPEAAPSPNAASGHITFGSFNNLTKMSPGTIAVWARVLEQLPGTRLMIKSKPLADEETRKRYLELFAAQGIGAERLDLVAWIPSQSGHLGAYGRIDIALDTFPYNGTTTTCEALWMGVPVVALRGDRFVARMGASILARIGLADLVAENTEGYVETAVGLAKDVDRLSALRATLRGQMRASPLCDAQGFARNLETAYRDMWRRWCRGARNAV